MKLFSTIERFRHWDRVTHVQLHMRNESDYNNETCENNTTLQTQRRSSARISFIGTTHPDDSDATRWDRHPWSEQADTAREFCSHATLWCTRQRDSSQYSPLQALTSRRREVLATRVPADQRVSKQRCGHDVSSINDALTVCRNCELQLYPRSVNSHWIPNDLVPDVIAANSSLSQLDSATLFRGLHHQESRHLQSSIFAKSCLKPSRHPCSTRALRAGRYERVSMPSNRCFPQVASNSLRRLHVSKAR